MDHLPLPPGSKVIEIPIVTAEDFDGGDFFSYPTRRGWDVSSWRSKLKFNPRLDVFNLTDGRTLDETLAFIQTWLCLGLIQCCLGRQIKIESFTYVAEDGRRSWTNGNLEEHMRNWKHDLDGLDQHSRDEAFTATLYMINEASIIASVLDSYARLHTPLDGRSREKLNQQIFLVETLQTAICSALRKIHRPGVWHGLTDRPPDEGVMTSWLEHQFELAKWCPYTVRNLKLHYDHDVQAFAYALGTVRIERDHTRCNAMRCVASQLDADMATKHRKSGCDCAHVEIDTSAVVEILKTGQIPAFAIEHTSEATKSVQLSVKHIEPESQYLAVSHVWADGLANPLANKLPTCQLEYLQHVVDMVLRYIPPSRPGHPERDPQSEGVRTLALWFDGLCIPVDPKYQAQRDFSISKMREIYENATGVLVLDPDLQMLGPSTTVNELLMRTLISGWASRLWTFQEGALAFHMFLVGDDCVFDLLDIRRNHLLEDEGLSVTLEYALRSRLMREIILSSGALQRHPVRSYQRLTAAVSGKSTSRPDDETVVIASFLDLDTTMLTDLRDPAERMITFMQMLPFIPCNIVFASGPRLSVRHSAGDWGWVPKTLLAPYGVADLIVGDNPIALDLSRPDELSECPRSYIHPGPEHGLAAFFPGILLSPTTNGLWFPITLHTSMGRFQVFETDKLNRTQPWAFRIPGLRAALILSSFEPLDMQNATALLVYSSSPSSNEDANFNATPGERAFRRVFVGGILRITGEQKLPLFGVEPQPFPAGAEDTSRLSTEFEGTLLNPTWWLINPFPADHEAEKRAWLTSRSGPPYQ